MKGLIVWPVSPLKLSKEHAEGMERKIKDVLGVEVVVLQHEVKMQEVEGTVRASGYVIETGQAFDVKVR